MQRGICTLKLLVLLCLFGSLVGVTPLAIGQQSNDERARTEAQLRALQEEIAARQASLTAHRDRLNASQRALRDIEQRVNNTSQALAETERELALINRQIESLATEKSILQSELQQQAGLLEDQIDAAYRAGNYQVLELLLNQADPSRLERLMEYYRFMNAARLDELATLHAKEAELVAVENQLTEAETRLREERNEQARQRNQLAEEMRQREQQIARIAAESASEAERLNALRQNEQELTELLATLSEVSRNVPVNLTGLANARNGLAWPVDGSIRHRFGEARSSQVSWSGLVFRCGPAEASIKVVRRRSCAICRLVCAVSVCLSLWIMGEGYMSLYGYNQALLFDVGEKCSSRWKPSQWWVRAVVSKSPWGSISEAPQIEVKPLTHCAISRGAPSPR